MTFIHVMCVQIVNISVCESVIGMLSSLNIGHEELFIYICVAGGCDPGTDPWYQGSCVATSRGSEANIITIRVGDDHTRHLMRPRMAGSSPHGAPHYHHPHDTSGKRILGVNTTISIILFLSFVSVL